MLPGGSAAYTVEARYGGDGTFAASTSSTVQAVTNVNKEASKVNRESGYLPEQLFSCVESTAAASLPYGSSYILLIAVTNSSGTLCVPPPFGTSVLAFGASPPPVPHRNGGASRQRDRSQQLPGSEYHHADKLREAKQHRFCRGPTGPTGGRQSLPHRNLRW